MDVFNTHTCANYAHTYAPPPKGASWTAATDRDAPVRLSQVWQLSQLVNATRQAVSAVVTLTAGTQGSGSCAPGTGLHRLGRDCRQQPSGNVLPSRHRLL